MKIKHTFTLYCLPFTLALFLVSCGTSGDGNGGESFEASDVSAANCADAAALNCFISQWDTTKTADGASYTNTIVLPLVENGEYDFYVDWGDETAIENITEFDAIEVTHTYAEEGEYTIHIAGEIKGWRFFVSEFNEEAGTDNDYADAVKLLDVSQWGSLSLGNTDGRQFYAAANFNPTASDAPDLSETTDLSYAFANASKFNAEIGNWDVSTVTNMEFMFQRAAAFDQDLSKWNVCKVTGTGWGSFDAGAAATWTAQEKPNWGMACPGGDNGGGDTGTDPITFADVSAANCADATAALNCFISTWDTTKTQTGTTGDGVSAASAVELPLVENGAYNFYVDWGDGTPTENITGYDDTKAAHTHEYAKSGEYTIHIAGEIKGWQFYVDEAVSNNPGSVDDHGDAVKLLDVSRWGSLSLGNTTQGQFFGAVNFNPTASDAPNLSETTSLDAAFQDATIFNGAIGNWNVSTITTMNNMFKEAAAFDQDLSNWDVSEVGNMGSMFLLASTFNSPLAWDEKTQNVTNMRQMFQNATLFNQDISGWNVGAVTDMTFMFLNAAAFDKDLSKWNVCKVNSKFFFDQGASASWTAAEKPNWGMDCPGGDNGGGDTGTDPITFADVSAANCADATAALNCFISQWDTTKTGDGASATNVVELPLVGNGEYNFYVDWGDETAIENITEKAPITHTYATEGEYTIHIAGEIKGWRFFVSEASFGDAVKLLDVSQWGSLSLGNTDGRQFQGAKNFNPTASDAPNLSETTSLAAAFQNATVFNGAIGNWDVSTITTMESMFRDVKEFERDLSSWGQKTKNVTSMVSMFESARNFNAPIGNWDVSAVTDMRWMFLNAPAFDKDLSGWNVCNVPTANSVAFDIGTSASWTAAEKPVWNDPACPVD